MAGYPRVIGEYVAGAEHYAPGLGVYGAMPTWMRSFRAAPMLPVHSAPAPAIQSAPWRPMLAPGNPPLGEGHVPLPLNAETYGGTWGGSTGAPAGTVITFSGRPQKPFKAARLVVRGTKVGSSAVGNLIGQVFVGTDLQQGELGYIDLESIGAATAFDTWLSLKQAEPGVWVRVQATLTAFPTGTDYETYSVTMLGHYLH
jgi:hypothetical protein